MTSLLSVSLSSSSTGLVITSYLIISPVACSYTAVIHYTSASTHYTLYSTQTTVGTSTDFSFQACNSFYATIFYTKYDFVYIPNAETPVQ